MFRFSLVYSIYDVAQEAAFHRFFYRKVFWKYAANPQENTHAEGYF